MSEAPKRIWADGDYTWAAGSWFLVKGHDDVEYIRADLVEAKLAKAVETLRSVINACDEGRMIPRPGYGVGGMTIEANIRGSVFTNVPAWPIEEARATLAELKGDKP